MLGTYLSLLCGLVFWIAVAWAMLAAMPEDTLGWRDQIAFAFWPITFALLLAAWILRKLFRRKAVPHIEALDLRPRETVTPPAPPAASTAEQCQGCDVAASEAENG